MEWANIISYDIVAIAFIIMVFWTLGNCEAACNTNMGSIIDFSEGGGSLVALWVNGTA